MIDRGIIVLSIMETMGYIAVFLLTFFLYVIIIALGISFPSEKIFRKMAKIIINVTKYISFSFSILVPIISLFLAIEVCNAIALLLQETNIVDVALENNDNELKEFFNNCLLSLPILVVFIYSIRILYSISKIQIKDKTFNIEKVKYLVSRMNISVIINYLAIISCVVIIILNVHKYNIQIPYVFTDYNFSKEIIGVIGIILVLLSNFMWVFFIPVLYIIKINKISEITFSISILSFLPLINIIYFIVINRSIKKYLKQINTEHIPAGLS